MADMIELTRNVRSLANDIYPRLPRKVSVIVMLTDMETGKVAYAHMGFQNPADVKFIFKRCSESKDPDKNEPKIITV